MHNPTAGDEAHSRKRLISVLAGAGHEVGYQSIKDDDWQTALRADCDLVVIAGGDGTVKKVFKELAGARTPATLVPVGSANNIARTLGFECDDAERLVRRWPDGTRRAFDLGQLNSPSGGARFVEAMGGGIFGEVLARAERVDEDPGGSEKLELGLRLLDRAIAEMAPTRGELEVDGDDVSGELLAVEAMNVRETSMNIPLAPDADPGDRMLDVALIRPDDRAALAAYVRARLLGRSPGPLRLEVHRAHRFSMRAPARCRLHVDEELWPESANRRAPETVIASAGGDRLEVLVPSSRVEGANPGGGG
jgi:diacylglycerol kinase (ATP)